MKEDEEKPKRDTKEETVKAYKYKPSEELERKQKKAKDIGQDPFYYTSKAKAIRRESQQSQETHKPHIYRAPGHKLDSITEHSIGPELSNAINDLKYYLSTVPENTPLKTELGEADKFITEKIVQRESKLTKEDLMEIQNKFGDTLLNLTKSNLDFEGYEGREFGKIFDMFSKITAQIIWENEDLSQNNLIGTERLGNESEHDFPDNLSELTTDEFPYDLAKEDIVWIPDANSWPSDTEHQSSVELPEQKEESQTRENGIPVSDSQDYQDSYRLDRSADSDSRLDEQAKLEGKERRKFLRVPKAIRKLFSPKRSLYTKIKDSSGEEEASTTSQMSEDGSLNSAYDSSFDVSPVDKHEENLPESDEKMLETESLSSSNENFKALEELIQVSNEEISNLQNEEKLDETGEELQQKLDESKKFERKIQKFTVEKLSSELQELGKQSESIYLDYILNNNIINDLAISEERRNELTLKIDKNLTSLKEISTKTGLLRAEYDRKKFRKDSERSVSSKTKTEKRRRTKLKPI